MKMPEWRADTGPKALGAAWNAAADAVNGGVVAQEVAVVSGDLAIDLGDGPRVDVAPTSNIDSFTIDWAGADHGPALIRLTPPAENTIAISVDLSQFVVPTGDDELAIQTLQPGAYAELLLRQHPRNASKVFATWTELDAGTAAAVPAWTLLAAVENYSATAAASWAAAADGDGLVAILTLPGPDHPAAATVTDPPSFAGWTLAADIDPSPTGSNPYMFVYTKTSDGTETTMSATIASQAKSWDLTVLKCTDASSLEITAVSTGSGSSATPPASNAAADGAARLVAACSTNTGVTASAPGGYTTLTDSSTNFGGHRVSARHGIPSGSISDGATTFSASDPHAVVAVLAEP